MLTFFSLLGGTLISEDLACIAAGLLIQRGGVSPAAGLLACTVGIFVGDVGLWGVAEPSGAPPWRGPGSRGTLQDNGSLTCRRGWTRMPARRA